MTKQQYADYEAAVANFLERNRVKDGCHGSKEEEPEPYFSWRPCGCCGSRLGGSREDYMFACEDGSTFEEAICTDCVYYLAYGKLDDMTMLEMKD